MWLPRKEVWLEISRRRLDLLAVFCMEDGKLLDDSWRPHFGEEFIIDKSMMILRLWS